MVDLKLRHVDQKEVLNPSKLKAVVIPLVTPFSEKSKKPLVQVKDLDNLVASVVNHSGALFPAGNAGEGLSLDLENYNVLLTTVINSRDKHSINRVPVLAGVLKKEMSEITEFAKTANSVGADGIIFAPMLSRDPYKALETVLDATSLPVLLYSNPSMTEGKEIPFDLVQFAKDESKGRVVGIKSSSKDIQQFESVLKLKNASFKVFQGNTADAADSLEMGADGIVSVEANIKPKTFEGLWSTSKTPNSVAFEDNRLKIDDILRHLKAERKTNGMDSSEIVKYHLVKMGIFHSSRKY
ncbi:MAG TPA: dihydrodipicolinate synthase family protein [Patescibacteria group bacterium]|nr:dihydrodipicolinate synthase family protein [Patescibacteria group bacterium]